MSYGDHGLALAQRDYDARMPPEGCFTCERNRCDNERLEDEQLCPRCLDEILEGTRCKQCWREYETNSDDLCWHCEREIAEENEDE